MKEDQSLVEQIAQLPLEIREEAVSLVGTHLRGFAQPIAMLPKLVISVGQALAKRDEEIDRAVAAERARCLQVIGGHEDQINADQDLNQDERGAALAALYAIAGEVWAPGTPSEHSADDTP